MAKRYTVEELREMLLERKCKLYSGVSEKMRVVRRIGRLYKDSPRHREASRQADNALTDLENSPRVQELYKALQDLEKGKTARAKKFLGLE